MVKKLCQIVKKDEIKDFLKEYTKLVDHPKFVCTKCGRAANDKKSLCKPEKI